MTTPLGTDRLITAWLEEQAPMREPDLGAVEKNLEIRGSRRVQINLERPADREQDKNPDVIGPQPPADGFPNTDRKMRVQQIGRNMFGPFLIGRDRPV